MWVTVLSNVLLCIVDEIRDKNSSVNNVMGAPDPTFGVGLDEKSTWDLTLEEMCKTLTDDLKTG